MYEQNDQAEYLVVDRSLTVTRRVRKLLEREGVDPDRIHEAFTAEDAFRLFKRHRPEATVLAMDLPDMGGHELAKDLWSLEGDARIVVHSDLPPRDRRVREMLEGGAVPARRKPLGRRQVGEIVGAPSEERSPPTPDAAIEGHEIAIPDLAEAEPAGPPGRREGPPPTRRERGDADRWPPEGSDGT